MKAAVTFQAEPREKAGTGQARALRRSGRVPAVLYHKGQEPIKLSLPLKDITLQYRKGGFQSKLVELKIGADTFHALPREVQQHPVTDIIEHADFLRVEANVPVRVMVPVKFLNVERSVGVKRGGVLNVVRHELELICRPESIPGSITIDVAEKDIGDSVHIKDVALPEGVQPAIKRNFTVATIAGRSAQMEEEAAPTAADTAAGAAEGAAAEGAAAAPGAAPGAAASKDAGKDAKAKK